MTLAVIAAITASFLWAMTIHIDKIMISHTGETSVNIKTLLVFSTLIAGIILSPIWLIMSNFKVQISIISLICVLLASVIYILGTYFYYKALERNDASIVVVMSQLIPVFSYVLALIFFKENLSVTQIIGSVIITLSAVLISFNFKEKNSQSKKAALFLMIMSSLGYAVYFFLFDIAIRHSEYNSCAFWYQMGFLILGIILFSIKSFRESFNKVINTHGAKYVSLNVTNEALNLGSNLLINFANVTIALALANVLSGLQGMFVFLIGIVGVKILPKYFKEDLSKKVVIQKIVCIILSILGLIVMFIR